MKIFSSISEYLSNGVTDTLPPLPIPPHIEQSIENRVQGKELTFPFLFFFQTLALFLPLTLCKLDKTDSADSSSERTLALSMQKVKLVVKMLRVMM